MRAHPAPRIRRAWAAALAAAPIAAGVVLVGATPARGAVKDHVVEMTDAAGKKVFRPAAVTINVGDSVTWHNGDTAQHNVTSVSANWAPPVNRDVPPVPPLNTTSYTFKAPGTYTYYCRFHGTKTTGMRGTVTVVDPAPPPSASPSPTRSSTPPPPPPPSPPPSSAPAPVPTPAPPPPPSPSASPTGGTGDIGPPPIGAPSITGGSTPPPNPSPTLAGVLPGGDEGTSPTASPQSRIVTGLGGEPSSHRARNTAVAVAAVLLGGLAWAEVRTLLATPVEPRPQA